MKEIERSAIVEHSAQEMYALVDDIESYPRFLPWCLAAEVKSEGKRKRATLTAGVSGIRQSFTTENQSEAGRAIDMRLDFSSRPLARLLEPLFNGIADTMVDAFTRRADELYGRDPG